MGWNDARVRLLPQGRTLLAEKLEDASTGTGEPVRMLHSVRVCGNEEGMPIEDAISQLLAHGFSEVTAPNQESAKLVRGKIHVAIYSENGMLAKVVLTFRLDRRTPLELENWCEATERICADLKVRLFDDVTCQPVSNSELRPLLAKTHTVQQLAAQFHWKLDEWS